jgi:hypothetical protein
MSESKDTGSSFSNADLMQEFSGDVWAKEFMKEYNKQVLAQNHLWVDVDLMRAWFCSAIMAGHDYARSNSHEKLVEEDKRSSTLLKEFLCLVDMGCLDGCASTSKVREFYERVKALKSEVL